MAKPTDPKERKKRKKKSRLARIGDALSEAMDTAAVSGALGYHLPNVGRNPLVDQRAMIEKPSRKAKRGSDRGSD